MTPEIDPKQWEVADRVSDKITAILNAEMSYEPIQLFVGQLLALSSLLRLMGEASSGSAQEPPEIIVLRAAVDGCLQFCARVAAAMASEPVPVNDLMAEEAERAALAKRKGPQ